VVQGLLLSHVQDYMFPWESEGKISVMCDSKGVINKNRKDLNNKQANLLPSREFDTLEQAVKGLIYFLDFSGSLYDVKRNAGFNVRYPIVFAMANP